MDLSLWLLTIYWHFLQSTGRLLVVNSQIYEPSVWGTYITPGVGGMNFFRPYKSFWRLWFEAFLNYTGLLWGIRPSMASLTGVFVCNYFPHLRCNGYKNYFSIWCNFVSNADQMMHSVKWNMIPLHSWMQFIDCILFWWVCARKT